MAKSALIIGAGITGVSCAEWLRRDGWDVTVIDPIQPGSRNQASFGNAGLIARTAIVPVATPGLVKKAPLMVFDPNSPLFLRWSYLPRLLPWLLPFLRNANPNRIREIALELSAMAFDATEQHLALSQGTGAEIHIRHGVYVNLYTKRSEYDSDQLSIDIRKELRIEPICLSRDELLDRDPNIGPDYTFGTMFKDYAWLTSPANYVKALFDYFRRNGGRFRQGQVVDIKPGDAPNITLEGGDILNADKVVLAAGAWSEKLARALGTRMQLTAERGYHVAMYESNFEPPNPYMLTDAKCVLTPMDGFLRAAGVAEFAGLNAPPSHAPTELISKAIKRLYPNLEFEQTETWMGRRPTSPDSLPTIGETAKARNVLHAYGGQHIGLTIGPKIGWLISALASGKSVNIDMSSFQPDRFG